MDTDGGGYCHVVILEIVSPCNGVFGSSGYAMTYWRRSKDEAELEVFGTAVCGACGFGNVVVMVC